MELLETMWSFVSECQSFLDCEIITSSTRLLTNKCFLTLGRSFLSGLSFELPAAENQTIIMTAFSPQEIKEELWGFVKIIGETSNLEENEFSFITDCVERKLPNLPTSQRNPSPRPKSYQCEECGKVFVKAIPLWMHKFQVHNKGNHQCKQCSKNFKTKGNLFSHIQQVHDEIKYQCFKCSKEFTKKGNMLRHYNKCKSLLK